MKQESKQALKYGMTITRDDNMKTTDYCLMFNGIEIIRTTTVHEYLVARRTLMLTLDTSEIDYKVESRKITYEFDDVDYFTEKFTTVTYANV